MMLTLILHHIKVEMNNHLMDFNKNVFPFIAGFVRGSNMVAGLWTS
jgi:iron-sulfur cluster repair protein YtfE (RIC family)